LDDAGRYQDGNKCVIVRRRRYSMPSFRVIAVAVFGCLFAIGGMAYAASDWLKGSAEQKFKMLPDV
jgi:TRAP-type C4-dicarboxylate transport system permease small subunit